MTLGEWETSGQLHETYGKTTAVAWVKAAEHALPVASPLSGMGVQC